MSSERSVPEPVEASIEDLHGINYETPAGSIQTDARATPASLLEEKLERELDYHKNGSYNCETQHDTGNSYHSSNPFLQSPFSVTDCSVRQPEQEKSSVHSWGKAEAVQPSSQESETWCRPPAGLYDSMNSGLHTPFHMPVSTSSPSLSQFNQLHPHSHFDRQQSWPAYPISDMTPGRLQTPSQCGSLQDQGTYDTRLLQ